MSRNPLEFRRLSLGSLSSGGAMLRRAASISSLGGVAKLVEKVRRRQDPAS
jgi:hypothetical protein